jgi:hypothetical protein
VAASSSQVGIGISSNLITLPGRETIPQWSRTGATGTFFMRFNVHLVRSDRRSGLAQREEGVEGGANRGNHDFASAVLVGCMDSFAKG